MHIQENPLAKIVASYSTEDLRRVFLVEDMFRPGETSLRWWETDRTVMGAIVPVAEPLRLTAPAGLRSSYFLERREAGLINLGGTGAATVDGEDFRMEARDALYIGRGAKEVSFRSLSVSQPARFWLVSYPAHT